ncbi:hypothetical protein JB92DRAFT_2831173 [Gautieria morchelliformis]|nr:hypothetical protein JB92DRAFT_2831173 [Gautieria morchelliformis]
MLIRIGLKLGGETYSSPIPVNTEGCHMLPPAVSLRYPAVHPTSETYVGGHVEALQAGVFRSDIPTHFKIEPDAVQKVFDLFSSQKLIDQLDAAPTFCISVESKMSLENATNYNEVKSQIQSALEEMRDNPARIDKPLIYHLDVAAMYPNIMLSNRVQPDSVIDESVCAVCDYNRPDKTCDRRMTWVWRGEFFPAHRDEFNMVKHALNQETFPPKWPGDPKRCFTDLTDAEQTALVYKKTKDTKVINRESIICQRENPFYIDTVHRFVDRRSPAKVDEAKKLIGMTLCNLRKGARWHSMEMAGLTCLTGTTIIQMARQLVEPSARARYRWNLVHASRDLSRELYVQCKGKAGCRYKVHSENSIFFELDGPYKAMILPSSKEEDKLLKKRCAVLEHDGSLAELDGFEVKRRGELQLIKTFQSQIFEKFLLGTTTEECYAAVAEVADRWLDVLFTKGDSLGDDELVELIAENRSMSKTLSEYDGQKSTSISTARRLAEFLGDQMVKDKALACKSIGATVTERAVPIAIFSAEDSVKRTYLRKWLKDNSLANFDLRSILDWNYYIERLGSPPAAMQKVLNPVPRIRHPDWLHKRVAALEDKFQQHKVTDFFKRAPKTERPSPSNGVVDIEDLIASSNSQMDKKGSAMTHKKPLPDPAENYSKWLKSIRPRWKERREVQLGGSTAQVVPSMFRGVKVRAFHSWGIIQIRPGRGPGRFTLWLAVDSELVPVTLRIPREFYLNIKSQPADNTFDDTYSLEQIVRTLLQECRLMLPSQFFNSYTVLLLSTNYVTKQPSLKLLGEILLDWANFNVMTRYISNEANLKMMIRSQPPPPRKFPRPPRTQNID